MQSLHQNPFEETLYPHHEPRTTLARCAILGLSLKDAFSRVLGRRCCLPVTARDTEIHSNPL
jgi:hypothetical protein